MDSNNDDKELDKIKKMLNNDEIRVKKLERDLNELKYFQQHEKEIRKKRYIFLLKDPNERKIHLKEFQDLTKEFSNSSSGSLSQRSSLSHNNTQKVFKSNSARGGRRKTRKTKRRGTKKNSKSHKKRRSLKKRH